MRALKQALDPQTFSIGQDIAGGVACTQTTLYQGKPYSPEIAARAYSTGTRWVDSPRLGFHASIAIA